MRKLKGSGEECEKHCERIEGKTTKRECERGNRGRKAVRVVGAVGVEAV